MCIIHIQVQSFRAEHSRAGFVRRSDELLMVLASLHQLNQLHFANPLQTTSPRTHQPSVLTTDDPTDYRTAYGTPQAYHYGNSL